MSLKVSSPLLPISITHYKTISETERQLDEDGTYTKARFQYVPDRNTHVKSQSDPYACFDVLRDNALTSPNRLNQGSV
eukprot:SAG11_NODE_3099_length_2694_cov_1.515607_3_plen_78_part_00